MPHAQAPGAPVAVSAPRSAAERRADTERLLAAERHLWLASGGSGRTPHLVPLSYVWEDGVITLLTRRSSRTGRNLTATGNVRVALGSATDVVLIDGTVELIDPADSPADMRARYARLPLDPDRVPGAVGVRLTPRRVLAWRHFAEMPGRLIMDDGQWLDR